MGDVVLVKLAQKFYRCRFIQKTLASIDTAPHPKNCNLGERNKCSTVHTEVYLYGVPYTSLLYDSRLRRLLFSSALYSGLL